MSTSRAVSLGRFCEIKNRLTTKTNDRGVVMDIFKRLRSNFRERYSIPECMCQDNFISEYPKYSTECAGNSSDVKNLVAKIRRAIEAGKVELPDYFVGVGNSGMGLASILSYEFDVPMIYIRKGKISRFNDGQVSTEREGHPNMMPKTPVNMSQLDMIAREGGWQGPTAYLGSSFWFVDDCIDSGATFKQAIHLCTYLYGMVLTGIGLSGMNYHTATYIKDMALLKNRVALPIFKRNSR
jgi:adenine/guanine phosphoribosyltransferase-like PRPP-binding protein